MKTKSIIVAAFAGVVLFSCSKDQRVVNHLEGEWKITSLKENGQAADPKDYEGAAYKFEKCKVKKGDCSGTLTITDPSKGSFVLPFTYNIEDKGETINITTTLGGTTDKTTGTILEHSKKKFVYTVKDGSDETETTLEPK